MESRWQAAAQPLATSTTEPGGDQAGNAKKAAPTSHSTAPQMSFGILLSRSVAAQLWPI